jgi:hypothetical protein
MKNTIISQLPVVLQTDTQKKFFEATFEQLFQKKQADTEIGWIGRRVGGRYDPQNDYFLSEGSFNRVDYQLEPIAFSRDPDTLEETNVMFYEDFLNYIKQHNGLINNHDRLFKTTPYSFAPPIDADKFINYQNYLWMTNDLPTIQLDPTVTPADIEGQLNYTITVDSKTIEASSGIHVTFNNPANAGEEYILEGVGCGIELVPLPNPLTAFDQFEFLPWDGGAELSGQNVSTENGFWDQLPWDAIKTSLPFDYITIERGAQDNNAWSRTNRWYHRDLVFGVLAFLEEEIGAYVVASRPIIEFKKNIELYKSGRNFLDYIDYVEDTLTFSELEGAIVGDVTVDNSNLVTGDKILIEANGRIYDVDTTGGIINLTLSTLLGEDNIVIVESGENYAGYTYYFEGVDYVSGGRWLQVANQKFSINQAPLYSLYDSNGVALDDENTYSFPSFVGNEIFSYKVNEYSIVDDTELGFPLEFTGLGQVGDIVFEHDLEAVRATTQESVEDNPTEIPGFYYYKINDELKTTWAAQESFDTADTESSLVLGQTEQNVIDRYVVTQDGNDTFVISQTPDDLTVRVNGVLEDTFSVNGTSVTIGTSTKANDVIEFYSYKNGNKDLGSRGYYEIPDALENNAGNSEVVEYSQNDMYKHFVSIIENQPGFTGQALGASNNFRDTCQDNSLGTYMLQTRDPLPLAMLSSSSKELDVVTAIRFASQEYTRYKNRFIKEARQLEIETAGFGTARSNFDEVITRLTNGTQFDEAFQYSYMFAWGTPTIDSETPLADTDTFTLSKNVDLTDRSNQVYAYINGNHIEQELFTVTGDQLVFDFSVLAGETAEFYIYENVEPAFVPATPSKLGMYQTYTPEKTTDTSFVTPMDVIVGHDGSRTPSTGSDFIDDLILEFETRIYNGINEKFLGDYIPPLTKEDIKPGAFRDTQYSYGEYVSVYSQSFSKWSNNVNAQWQDNTTFDAGDWKTWNYSEHGVPGHWKGLYQYFYDTFRPHTHPWEMLGFAKKPDWWDVQYLGNYTSTNTGMWSDLEAGIIRMGSRQGVDSRFARPGMVIPVDASGDLLSPDEIDIDYVLTTNSDNSWLIGDQAPTESGWMNTEVYPFAVMEFLFLMRPAQFGYRFWDTNDNATSLAQPSQHISAETLDRRKYSSLSVHGELIDGELVYREGYQQWIADGLFFNARTIKSELGDKVRRLGVKLGHKMGGFTNPDTIETFLEGTSAESTTNGLLIPKENVETNIHTSPAIDEYTYSGVVVLAQEDGSYRVFGYDIISNNFKIIPRDQFAPKQEVRVGNDEAPFTLFDRGVAYQKGDIVKYNGVYYSAKEDLAPGSFDDDNWNRLSKLPSTGGIEVSYTKRGQQGVIQTVPYGTIFQTEQEVFDFLIGYGDYLEAVGWKFDETDNINYRLQNWLESAKEYLFWVTANWAPGQAIRLSPSSRYTKLDLARGYAGDLKIQYNGVYSILDENGFEIKAKDLVVERDDFTVNVKPLNQDQRGIYLLRVYATETEHRVTFDNKTSFADIIYDPLLGVRQNRLRFIGPRTLDWSGKREAPGYVITDDNRLIPNLDTLAESIRRFHDTESRLDRQEVEDTARHIIGFENRDYLVDLDIRQDTQYQFYQGVVRQKGTEDAINKILRSTNIVDGTDQTIEVFEEFALRLGHSGATCTTQQLDLAIDPRQIKTNPQIVQLDINPETSGFVKEVVLVNVESTYSEPPLIEIRPSINETNPITDHAQAVAILGDDGKVASIEVTHPGSGYTQEPNVYIPLVEWDPSVEPDGWSALPWDGGVDRAIAILGYEVTEDDPADDLVLIDKDDTESWLTKPTRGCDKTGLWSMIEPMAVMPTAGPLNTKDLSELTFSGDSLVSTNVTDYVNVGIARTLNDTWDIYNLVTDYGNGTMSISQLNDGNTILFAPTIENNNDFGFYVDDTAGSGQIINYGYVVVNDIVYRYERQSDSLGPLKLFDATGEEVQLTDFELTDEVKVFSSRRFTVLPAFDPGFEGDILYVEDDSTVYTATATEFTAVRRWDNQRVNTKIIKNAFVYEADTKDTLALVNIYDPVKGFIPGIAEQNIDIKSYTDPARYTNSDNESRINESLRFTKRDVGKTWLDLSSFAYYDYEQDDMRYRRERWGKQVPGSDLSVYEWVESLNPPASYDGAGTPRNTTDYTVESVFNDDAGFEVNYYYFWVRGLATRPENDKNRTLSIANIEQLMNNPKAQGYQWFSPIDTDKFVFANLEDLFENNEAVFQINYKDTDKDTNLHVEWYLMGDGNRNSPVKDIHWDKMTDSLVGFTKTISTADMPYIVNLPGAYLLGTDDDNPGETLYQLAVPNPALSVAEKYGTENRPRQSWFIDKQAARKVFTQKANDLFANMESFDATDFSNWVSTSNYWIINDEGNVEILSTLYTDYILEDLRSELREILDAMRNHVFIGDDFVKQNELMFAMINYVLSEQKDVDWVFKTTYVTLNQEAIPLEQAPTLVNDPFESLLEYVNEVKPYQSKVRDYKNAFKTLDLVEATVTEFDNKLVKMRFNRVECPELAEDELPGYECQEWINYINADDFITPSIPWDILPFDEEDWDGDAPVVYYEAAGLVPDTFEPGAPLLSLTGDQFVDSISPGTVEFDLSTETATQDIDYSVMGVYLNGEQLLNYYIYNSTVYIMAEDLLPTDVIDIYEVILPEGDFFLDPLYRAGNPQELVPMKMHEGVVLDVRTQGVTVTLPGSNIGEYPVVRGFTEVRVDGVPRTDYTFEEPEAWDQEAWDSGSEDWDNSFLAIQFDGEPDQTGSTVEIDYPEVNYRQHVNMSGLMTYERKSRCNTTLAADFAQGDIEVELTDASVMPEATVATPQVAWIGQEKITYRGIDGNTLVGVNRAERNTAEISIRPAGTDVWIGGESEMIIGGEQALWTDNFASIVYGLPNTLALSGTNIGTFLRGCP